MPKTKMKKTKKELNTVLALAICLIAVAGSAYGLNFLKNNFEKNNTAIAETLPPLPAEVKQNQISEIILSGYLADSSFYSAK